MEAQSETQPVNLTLLDGLVVDYLYHEGILDENLNRENAEFFGKYQGKTDFLKGIRSSILEGKITEAVGLIAQFQPAVLKDPKLLFKLHKQKVVELLRIGEDPKQVLSYVQSNLTPLSSTLPAEFKSCVLLVLYQENASIPSLAAEWSLAKREELAFALHTALLESLGVKETTLPLLLRYLITYHNLYHVIHGLNPVFQEIERIVLPEKLPAPVVEAPVRQNNNDVQALQQSLCISQQEAQNALNFTQGNVEEALKNELGRIQLDHSVFIEMIFDYCEHRGIISHEQLLKLTSTKTTQPPVIPPEKAASSDKITTLRRIREALMTNQGIREAVTDILDLDPNFPKTHPTTFFQLKQFELRECLHLGNLKEAVAICSNDLAPMAKTFPELEPSFRNSVVLLAFPPQSAIPPALCPSQHPSALAGPLYTMLGQRLSLSQPRILKMIKYLFCIHTEWFKQNIIPDRFEKVFKLNELKKGEANQLADGAPHQGNPQQPVPNNQQQGAQEEPHPMNEEHPDEIDEGSIATLIEIMGFTRDQAVALLQENGGDVNEVLQILLA